MSGIGGGTIDGLRTDDGPLAPPSATPGGNVHNEGVNAAFMGSLGRAALSWIGVEITAVSHAERVVSSVGGFIGILLVLLVSLNFVGPGAAPLIVASMGASAVLVFAVPHGALSQPWPLVGGHLLSALVGVGCAKLVSEPILAAPLAVGLAIGVMYYLRCIHPPGGATALSAVVGGSPVESLGYQYVLTPVLLNVAVILAAAVGVNYAFNWRRYPVSLVRREPTVTEEEQAAESVVEEFSHEDLEYALRRLDSYVDVTEEDLNRIYALAVEHAQDTQMPVHAIKPGRYYSNGRYGQDWSVREVIDEEGSGGDDLVAYYVVAGKDRNEAGGCSRREFAHWAHYEVIRAESHWRRVGAESSVTG